LREARGRKGANGANGGSAVDSAALAQSLEAASRVLREWQERLAEDGPRSVWVVVSNVDPLHRAPDWVDQVVEMEHIWCAKLKLSADVAAYELAGEDLERVVLEVDGPGALAYLAMEHGVDRLAVAQKRNARVSVQVVPRSERPSLTGAGVESIRHRSGRFQLPLSCLARIELPERGMSLELLGSDRETLSHLIHDLGDLFAKPSSLEVARVYGEDGVGARDPRTDARVLRLKDPVKGRLDRFLEGWRQQARD
jgi:hypothetical protein